MKMDKYFQVFKKELISDGMGGWIESDNERIYGSIYGFVSPVSTETLLKEHEIISTHAMKIFSKQGLPLELSQEEVTLQFVDYKNNIFRNYKILQYSDFGKYKMYLVEEVD